MAVFCPSGAPDCGRTRQGLTWLEEQGLIAVLSPLLERWMEGGAAPPLPYLAGSDAERIADIRWALEEVDCQAAWAARGGYGLTRILEGVEVAPRDRLVVGFSDITALFCRLRQLGWQRLLHAPNLQSLFHDPQAQGVNLSGLQSLLLEGRLPGFSGEALVEGEAEGWLGGGNLCVMASLCGTAQQPDFQGALLFLEDVTEKPYRLDRYLTQFLASGVVEGVRGVILGEFTDCGAEQEIRASLMERLREWKVPVLAGLPCGHGNRNEPLPLGLRAILRGNRLDFLPG